MKISVDYDDTYTRDPVLFDRFIRMAEDAGHEVVCLTMRHPTEPIEMPCPVIYTGRKAKSVFAAENGIKIDVWVDDSPKWLLQDG